MRLGLGLDGRLLIAQSQWFVKGQGASKEGGEDGCSSVVVEVENTEISDPEEDDLVQCPQHFELGLGASLGLEDGENHLVLTADLVDGNSLTPAEYSMSSIHVDGGGLG